MRPVGGGFCGTGLEHRYYEVETGIIDKEGLNGVGVEGQVRGWSLGKS